MTGFTLPSTLVTAADLPMVDPCSAETLALFGHDLRSALSDVIGGLRLISPEAVDQIMRIQIDRVRVSAEALARLLDRGLSETLGGDEVQQPQRLNLHRFLTDVDLRWSGRALELGIGFVLVKAADLPAGLLVDQVALDRVLSNLLGNAFKYGGRGQVVCEVGMRAGGGLRLMVRDDGPGFPANILGHAQTIESPAHEGAQSGSGMGLRIAADLTRRLGGQLTLRNPDASTGQSGAEAIVDMPISVLTPQDLEAVEVDPILTCARVLIADDNSTSQTIVAGLARNLGADVVVVGDGVEAVERLEAERFDLLIVDVEMPRLSGLDVIRCLRRMPGAVARLPVIAVTAYGLPSKRKTILAAGADDLLTKPILCPQAFASVVRSVLQGKTPGALPAVAADPTPARPVAVGAAHKVLALDENRLHRLLEMAGPETGRDLLDRLVSDLETVRNGLLQAAPEQTLRPDWGAVRSHSHVLISLAGAVGAQHLQSEAEAMNHLAHQIDLAALRALLPDTLHHLGALIDLISEVRRTYLVASR